MTSIKHRLTGRGLLNCLIINVVVWVVARVSVALDAPSIPLSLQLPARVGGVLAHPWTILSYMFVQYDVLHLLSNMLMLYWFGRMCHTLGQSRLILPSYIAGGLLGAGCYLLTSIINPAWVGSGLVGASASVIAIGVLAALTAPRLKTHVWLIGEVELRWIAVAIIALFCIGALATSVGALVAHAGGVAAGVAVYYLRRYNAARRRASLHTRQVSPEQIDHILDKVKRSGYSSLNAKERHALFEMSRQLNRK